MNKLLQLLMFPACFATAMMWDGEVLDEALEDEPARLATDDILLRIMEKDDE